MKSIGIIQIIAISLVSLFTSISNAVIAGPGAPTLIGFQQPYEINVCEDDWPTLELNINAIPGLNYRWDDSTDPAVLAALEFNTGNTRVRIADADALPKNVAIFLVVQAVDATGCESFPTVIRLFLVPKLNVIAMPLDTACVGRPFPISPKNLIASIEQNRVDSLSWNFGGNAEVVGGESSDLDDFIIAFNSAGMHSITMDVLDTRGCRTQISYDFTVFTAPPLPEILPCTYMGTDSIFFEWSIDNTFTNTMNIDLLPPGATIVETPTSLLVTGIAGGPTQSTTVITVSAEGTSPMPCNITSQTAICRSCIPVNFIYDGIPQNSFCAGDDGLIPVPLTVDVVTDAFMVTDPVEGNWEPGLGVEFVGGQAFFNPAGLPPGEYGAEYEYIHPVDNCPHTGGVGFTIFEAARPNASLSSNSVVTDTEICSDETVIIHFDRYEDIPRPNIFSDDVSGQVTISRASASSVRVSFGNIESDYQIFVEYSLPGCEPRTDIINVSVKLKPEVVVTCGPQQTDAVEVSWNALDGVTTYEILLDGVSQGPVSGLTTTIPGLDVNVDYVVTVIPQTLGCAETGSITCSTGGCVDPIIDLSSLADPRCYLDGSGPINLDVSIVSALTGDPIDYNWDTPLVDVDNNFQPNPAQELYTFDIAYSDGSCTGVIQAVDFTVIYNPEPILAFSTQDTICILDGTADLIAMTTVFDPLNTVTYEGIFPVGVNPTATGDGQWLMQFDGPGSYTVGVKAIYQDCEGEAFREIVVESPAPLDVQCGPQQPDAVEVSWNALDGVPTYEILLDGVSQGPFSGMTATIPGLADNMDYVVTVIPLTLGCAETGSITCSTGGCADPIIDLASLADPRCYLDGSGPINLDVSIVSALTGDPIDYNWDTPLVDVDNNFQPNPAQELYTFDITYTDSSCTGVIQAVDFTVIYNPEPILAFSTQDTICILDGTADLIAMTTVFDPLNTVTYEGIFPVGVNPTATGDGQWSMQFDGPGSYTVGVKAIYQGCEGEAFREIVVESPAPLDVQCGPQQNDIIEVTWPMVDGVTDFEILLDGTPYDITTGTSGIILGLDPEESYEVTVIPLNGSCTLEGTVMCTTGSCDPAAVDLSALTDNFCYVEGSGPINLDVNITSTNGNPSTYVWDSPLIDMDNNFVPDPAQELYTFDIIYTEGNCIETIADVSFTVITVPELDLSFSTPDSICILDGSVDFIAEAMVADPSALVIEGIFPAGVTETETLTGQWILNFDMPGTYEVGARATYQGCQSIEFFRTIFVDQDLGAPVVTATPGVGNVELTWEPPTYCVSSWEIFVESESIGTTSALTFTVPLEEVRDYDITVVALSNGCVCGDEMTLITESPLPCPDIDIMTLPIDTCFNPTLAPFDMPVTVTESPLLPAGSGTWSGQLIDVNGQVDVSQTNFGDVFQLEYSYTQGNCTTVVTELISLSEPPNIINVESMPPPCSDDSLGTVIVLVEGGTPDYLYSVNGSMPQADNVIPGVELGLAMVEVTDARGCAVQELVDVMDNLLPNLDVSGPEVVLENNDADFTISTNILMTDITNISWFLDGELQDEGVELTTFSLLDVEQSGTIEVVVEYGMECTLFASTDFTVNEVQSIYIPNIVDYSGVSSTANAEWKAFIDGDQAFILSVQVYDRWGNKIRDFENVNRDSFTEFLLWDGFFGSVPAEQGVYSYVIETEILGNTKVERGSITILR